MLGEVDARFESVFLPDGYAMAACESPLWRMDEVHWTERHLQCVWYDSRYRPAELRTLRGEVLEVIQPGVWNLEAGPDFLNAEVRVSGAGSALRGDVEIHVRPGDWVAHGHGDDPRYSNVILHVTYFPVRRSDADRPAPWLQVSLQEALEARRDFSFADIDVKSYPHANLPRSPRPCGEVLERLPPRYRERLLESAGRHRLLDKSRRISARLKVVGDRYQVFYEETLSMLGARRNIGVCRTLATLLPRGSSAEPMERMRLYALLLGKAGLLPDPQKQSLPEASQFARELWDEWFRGGGGAEEVIDRGEWVMAGSRPANHPLRRLAMAAGLFAEPTGVLDALDAVDKRNPAEWMKRCVKVFASVPGVPYWERRLGFDTAERERAVAGLGANRISAIMANVVLPLYIAEDGALADLAEALPAEDIGAPARESANRLFGRDHNPALYAGRGLLQQGLLAIHHDFCLQARGGCENCRLARYLRESVEHETA